MKYKLELCHNVYQGFCNTVVHKRVFHKISRYQFTFFSIYYEQKCISNIVHEVFRFQRIYAKYFNVRNQIKSMFSTICNTYCIIQCKIKIICYINSQKLIAVQCRF